MKMKECSERNTNCEFCLIDMKVSQSSDHSETCPNFPLKCSNGCSADRIPREDMNLHVSEFCPLTMIPCPYNKYGCNTSRKREDIDTHEMEFVVKHVRMMDTGMKLLKTQVHTLTSRIEDMNIAIQHNIGMEWEIKGVREKFEENKVLFSDPFYVNNYKFQAWTNFNAEDNNELGIFVRLCVGVLDDSLKWPFLGEVIVTLINMRNSVYSITKSFLTKDNECFTRPTEDKNGTGYPSFATVTEVLTRFSDKMQIKIKIKSLGKSDGFVRNFTS